MSNLLERAIIDAKALKEAALKNAEQLVIEKYSQEVKTAVDKLLEQEDPLATDMDMGLDAGLEDPLVDPAPDMEQEDPESAEEEALDPDSVLGTVPSSFLADDDEIISIKLDSLEAEFEDEEEGPFASGDEFDDEDVGIDILDDEDELELDDDVDFDMETDEMPETDSIGVDITSDVMQEVLDELGVSADEIDIDVDEIMERVRVDFEPQKSGWAGTPESLMKEYEAMLLAREQDSEVKEENEELRKTVAKLQKENKTLTSAATKLQAQTKKYETAFDTLQERLETMNVSNAKLLYINQALENASLNERQKRKIVEAISKAESVQEAKIVFDTISETVTTTSDVRRDETLSEVVSRRSSLLVAARNEQPEKDANPLYNRLQKLAGIKTN
jgi:hypothetical protein